MVAEQNPAYLDLDLDRLDDALTRSIEQATAASGRLVLHHDGVPVALVVPIVSPAATEQRGRDWEHIRVVLAAARDRFADVLLDELQAAIDVAADESGEEVWRERADSRG